MKLQALIFSAISFGTFLALAGRPFHEAPNNTFEKMSIYSRQAQSIKHRYHSSKGVAFLEENLRPLRDEDFVQIDSVRASNRELAIRLIREGKVIAVDSVVGNATRLGNPPGGKGAVIIHDNITFLDAKIFRLAMDSHAIGYPIKQILWTSDENMEAIINLLNSLDSRLDKMSSLSSSFRKVVREYLNGSYITLMAQSTLFPVIDEHGELAPDRYRNLGAGELVPTIFRSGANKMVDLKPDSIVVFSNVDFDLSYVNAVAASLEAKRPDLMQVHIKTTDSGGSAYWVKENNSWRIIPLENFEVPASVLAKASTLNSNAVVLQGSALNVRYYENLPFPFEKKVYDGKVYFLPKLSLSDIGKSPKIKSAVAIGKYSEYFFEGSKNTGLLAQMGAQEIVTRISRWNEMLEPDFYLKGLKCAGVFH